MRMAMMGSRPGPPGEAKEDSRVTMGPHTPTFRQGQIADALIMPMVMRSTML